MHYAYNSFTSKFCETTSMNTIISKSEKKNIKNCRQFLVAKKNINKNEIFSFRNLTCKRIGKNGISPMKINNIINKKSKKAYKKDEKI